MLTTPQIIKKYGHPDEEGKYLVYIDLPFPMRLAWDKKVKVTRIRVHRLAAESLLAIYTDILAYYGYEKIVALGIDIFGGCFNYRAKRGGTDWSTHTWGIAVDHDPERNLLHETRKTARFARPEYQPMIDIFYKHGWLSYGRERNNDFMHFEVAS